MKNAIYLGDIDPNNNVLPVIDIRRIIMFQLLIWDKIILSDSQFLTDPRLSVLMRGYCSDDICKKYGISDIDNSLRGIETLFQEGLVEVAMRQNASGQSDLFSTWQKMSTSEKKVPYLPEDETYIHYLGGISCHSHTYQTTNMADLFQHNLEAGIHTDPLMGGVILHNNDVETELKHLFQEKAPLFRNIYDYLLEQKRKGNLSSERYQFLYDYVYSCYSVNISSILGCNISTKFAHIPFHLESGTEYIGKNIASHRVENLRPTWALNPIFLDYLSFDEFAKIRRRLNSAKVREFYMGTVESPWVEIEDAWEEYTMQLEQAIKLAMYEKKDTISSRVIDEISGGKYLANPRQYVMFTPFCEVVKSLVSFIPGVGNIFGITDFAKGLYGAVVTLAKRNEKLSLAKEYSNISKLVSRETRVVTKYSNPL